MLCSHDYVLFLLEKNIVCMGSWTYCRNFGKAHRNDDDSYGLLNTCSLPGNVESTSHVFIHLTPQEPHGIGTIIISIL